MALGRQPNPESKVTRGRLGEVLRVGNLELTVIGSGPFTNSKYSFSTSNYQVRFRASNLPAGRGAEYVLATDMKIVDSTGQTRDTVPCVQCPGRTGDDLSLRIPAGGTLEGVFYYKLAPGMEPVYVTYRSLRAEKEAKVDLRPSAPVAVVPR